MQWNQWQSEFLQLLFLQLSAHCEVGFPLVPSSLPLFISIPWTPRQQYWIQELKYHNYGYVWVGVK